jgi:4-hydroxythreonine-4-phosphate dehydrogenase
LFGHEEIEVLQPCLATAKQEGLDVHGPFAPDTVFMRARQQANGQREFDVVIAMYHDQGLIPVKYLGVEQGVNVTLGLPLIRTSPDHGTAFDVAGKGIADARSMLQAIHLARQMVS